VRPLFVGNTSIGEIIFASEAKSSCNLLDCEKDSLEQFTPGCWKTYSLDNYSTSDYNRYHTHIYPEIETKNIPEICLNIKRTFLNIELS
ncbi:MAG: hypothetical protein ABGX43_00855, partial [Nitrospinaceae bacterium]